MSSLAAGIFARVNEHDLELQKEKIEREREIRRALRRQAESHTVDASELIQQLYGSTEDASSHLKLPKDEVAGESRPAVEGSFPAPPKSGTATTT